MVRTYLIFSVGLILLIKGADYMIGAASKIGKQLRISAFIVGIIIVALGTSAPEAAIGIISGLQQNNLITLGGVVGSSIVNITLILGFTIVIFPIKVDSKAIRRELLLLLAVQVILAMMLLTADTLSQIEALILVGGMIAFIGYINSKAKQRLKEEAPDTDFESEVFELIEDEQIFVETIETAGEKDDKPDRKIDTKLLIKQLLIFAAGFAGLIFGADLSVKSAVTIADALGLSEEFIGLTVVAIGTSLPELVVCLVAALKKEEDIALGNIIGSNILNILFVLGISGLLHPIRVADLSIYFDILIMAGTTVLLIVPTFRAGRLSKITGSILIGYYIIYLAFKLSSL